MSLAWFHETGGTMSWIGVGNVEGMLLRLGQREPSSRRDRREMLLLRPGVVGGTVATAPRSSIEVAGGTCWFWPPTGSTVGSPLRRKAVALRVRSPRGSLRATAAPTTMPSFWSLASSRDRSNGFVSCRFNLRQ